MTETVKLTLRLPAGLHRRIKERAAAEHYSLNAMLVETIRLGLEKKPPAGEDERTKIRRILREAGLLRSPGPAWPEVEDTGLSREELWEMAKDVPPLSELILAEREPR